MLTCLLKCIILGDRFITPGSRSSKTKMEDKQDLTLNHLKERKELNSLSRGELVELIRSMEKTVSAAKDIVEKMELYSSIIEQTSESVAVQDLEGNYIYTNPSYEKLRGYSKKELFLKEFLEKYSPEEQAKRQRAFDEIMQTGYWRGELNFSRKNGTYVATLCTSVLMKNSAGHPVAVVGLITDMTDVKTAQMELEKAKREAEKANRAKSHFLANMSHEIRTPMNAIIGFTSLLLEEEDDEEKRMTLEMIDKSSTILLDLINGILDLSKIEAGKLQTYSTSFQIKETLNSIKNMFTSQAVDKSIDYRINFFEDFPDTVFGDQRLFRQIILNIIGNAFKFTKQGMIEIECNYSEGMVEVKVSDTGIGIAEGKQQQIFKPFTQANRCISSEFGGTGLGLSISMHLAKIMNGMILLESVPEKGSVFTVRIPMPVTGESPMRDLTENRIKYPKTGNITQTTGKGYRDIRILIAEDNEINQKLIKRFVTKIGCPCEVVSNGEEALLLLRKKNYDILLLDLQMPVMDGETLLRIIRLDEKLSRLYVIAQTAYAMKGDKERILSMGCDGYVSKPIDRNKLAAAIDKFTLERRTDWAESF